jgi:hypothetical protein
LQFVAANSQIATGVTVGTNTATIVTAGRYKVSALVSVDRSTSPADDVSLEMTVNGAVIHYATATNNAGNHNEFLATSGLVDLAPGDVIDWRIGVGSTGLGNVFIYNQTLAIEQQPTATVIQVDPGLLQVTQLASGQTADGAITHNQSTTSASFVDVTGASITLPGAGTYEIEYSIPTNNNTAGQANVTAITDSANNVVAGTYSAMGEASGGGYTGPNIGRAEVTVTAAATYKVRWRVSGGTGNVGNDTANSGSAWMRYRQLPATTVVDIGDVPVTALTMGETIIPAGTAGSGTTPADVAGSSFTLPGAGTYEVEYSVTGFHSGANLVASVFLADSANTEVANSRSGTQSGASAQQMVMTQVSRITVTGPTTYKMRAVMNTAGSFTLINSSPAVGNGNMGVCKIAWKQLPTSTVVNPGTVPVNDQAASGYFDIGTMRHQWGTSTVGATSASITLPAPFANSAYSVTGSRISSTVGTVLITSRAAGAFTAGIGDLTNAWVAGSFCWVAIGLKP